MFEYAAVLGGSLKEQVGDTFVAFGRWLGGLSPLWYVGGVLALFLLTRLFRSK